MDKVYQYLLDLELQENDTIVIGVSGGPDSMTLLSLLIKLRNQKPIKIICAHVNHNVRQESSSEKEFVLDYCKQNDVQFEYMLIEKYGTDNFHNEARIIRYKFFDELVHKYHARYLFMAHHGDDLIETVLMRIVRGSLLKGYAGFSKEIEEKDYKIIRPLISVTKDEIYAYLDDNNIHYVVDKSNFKDVYTRNRYRMNILPFLKKEDGNVHEKFARFSATLDEYDSYVKREIYKIINKVYNKNVLDIDKFLECDFFIQKRIIEYILEKFYQDDLFLINSSHVKLIMDLINSSKVNSMICLPNKVVVRKTYNEIVIMNDEVIDNQYEILFDKMALLPSGKKIEVVDSLDSNSNYTCRLNSQEIKLPLIIRNRHDGDKMHVKNMSGTKKINDIFIEHKIDLKSRETWPVVFDSDGNIVWLPGLKKSKYDKQNNEKYDIILKYY